MKLRHILAIAMLVLLVGTGAAVAIARLAHSPANHIVGGTGATLPYTEIEAEQAATNGTIIGPDITFTHLASEASGRQAVTLTQGQYVEFTLPRAANSIDVRYSIPDSADGAGLTAPIALYINGTYKQDLIFTSRYGWFYGGFPFSNKPANGLPHHFYDETRALLGEMPAGTKVRLQVDSTDTAPAYTIDLADFEEVAAPLTAPAGYLTITDPAYGADPTGARDATQAIQQAITAGEQQGQGVWIPPGTFTVTGHLLVDNVTLAGAGPWYSVLHGAGVGIFGHAAPNPSQHVHLADFAIFGEVTERVDSAPLNAIGGAMGGDSVISDIWIEHTKVGMWFDGPFSGLTITNCRIRDTTADGINLHDGISNTIVQQTEIRNTGDDGLAMWSEIQADAHDTFAANTIQLPILANGIAIYGGADNTVINNVVSDTLTEGGGIHVGNRFNAVPLSGTTTITHNTLTRTGCFDPDWDYGVGALWFYALDAPMTGTIKVTQLEIDQSSYEAIQFTGAASIDHVTLDQVNIHGAGTFAVQEQTGGSATFSNVTSSGLGASGVYNCGQPFTITQGPGNAGWDKTSCGFPANKP